MTPSWLLAGLVGLLAGAGLLLGALVGYAGRLGHRGIARVMGFGAGVLVAIATLEMLAASTGGGSRVATAFGFAFGAVAFSGLHWRLELRGAGDRKRCGRCVEQPTEQEVPGSGLAIAIGTLLDGLPTSMAIGLSVALARGALAVETGAEISVALVAGLFVANIPQGISGASGMRHAGRGPGYLLAVWGAAVLAGTVAAVGGAVAFVRAGDVVLSGLTALAAGGIISMLAETMVPEAFHLDERFIGAVVAGGCLVALLL